MGRELVTFGSLTLSHSRDLTNEEWEEVYLLIDEIREEIQKTYEKIESNPKYKQFDFI